MTIDKRIIDNILSEFHHCLAAGCLNGGWFKAEYKDWDGIITVSMPYQHSGIPLPGDDRIFQIRRPSRTFAIQITSPYLNPPASLVDLQDPNSIETVRNQLRLAMAGHIVALEALKNPTVKRLLLAAAHKLDAALEEMSC